MWTWFSDLDNTLIYSHRTTFTSEKIIAEWLNGKEQSYITKETYSFMKNMECNFVPVTTRSIEQYKRIYLFEEEIPVKYALVCNGAILLVDGKIDIDWYEESKRIVQQDMIELHRLRERLSEYDIKELEDMMLYFKAERTEQVAKYLKEFTDNQRMYIGFDKRKVYCIPVCLSKGNAIQRFCNRFEVKLSVASGDSEFDLSMLNTTNVSLLPSNLLNKINENVKRISLGNDVIISDILCKYLSDIFEEKNYDIDKRVL